MTQGSTTLRSFTYDPDGDTATDARSGTTYTYTYDSENRLATAKAGATLVGSYTYDGLWRLAKRVVTNVAPSGETHFAQDLEGRVIVETDATGASVREYVWLDDLPVAVIDAVNTASPVTYFVHTDHLQRPVALTNAAKAVVWSAAYQPFGATQSITGSVVLNARFPGQWYQLETGLHYNWHRHYDPSLGRYVQPDPLGFADGPSIYGYAGQNPLAYVDPEGELALGGPLGGFLHSIVPRSPSGEGGSGGGGGTDPNGGMCYPSKNCRKASSSQLSMAGISGRGAEHKFKDERDAVPNSAWDICACDDGSVVIKAVGQFGYSETEPIETDARWK